ncbi:MAG: RNA polymerase sigma factor [Lentisphaerae bacterium]|nr:RNA polymerase sigma factor [Lentisphaerota bacterium]
MNASDLRGQLEQHHAASYGWAMSCCAHNPEEAADVLQSAYLKILQGRARFSGRSAFKTWLFTVIRRTAADQRRRHWLRRVLLERFAREQEPAALPTGADKASERGELWKLLRAALERLPNGSNYQAISMNTNEREAPRGKPRGNLLRRSSSGYAGRVFAEPCEAKDAILSSIAASATEDPLCGRPQGFLAKKGDDRLRSLFQELKSRDLQDTPSFDGLCNAAARRERVQFFTPGLRLAMAAVALIMVATSLTVYQVKTRQAAAEAHQWAALADWQAATDGLLAEASTPWGNQVGTSLAAWLDESWPNTRSLTIPENERRGYEQES